MKPLGILWWISPIYESWNTQNKLLTILFRSEPWHGKLLSLWNGLDNTDAWVQEKECSRYQELVDLKNNKTLSFLSIISQSQFLFFSEISSLKGVRMLFISVPNTLTVPKRIHFLFPFCSISQDYRYKGASEAAKVGGIASLIRSVTGRSVYSPHTGSQTYELGVEKVNFDPDASQMSHLHLFLLFYCFCASPYAVWYTMSTTFKFFHS